MWMLLSLECKATYLRCRPVSSQTLSRDQYRTQRCQLRRQEESCCQSSIPHHSDDDPSRSSPDLSPGHSRGRRRGDLSPSQIGELHDSLSGGVDLQYWCSHTYRAFKVSNSHLPFRKALTLLLAGSCFIVESTATFFAISTRLLGW